MSKTVSPEATANKARIRKLQSFQNTDAGNAETFEYLHQGRFRWDNTRGKWLVWKDRYWAEDNDGEASRAALLTARERLLAASLINHEQTRKVDVRWALDSESVARRRFMLISAQSIRSLSTITEDYDRDPFLLTVGNGTIDLRTGKLRKARREDLITRATAVPYDRNATAPRWAEFLIEVFNGDLETIGYIQRAVGYSLTGSTREQCFFLLCGPGANGKSTFLETIIKLMGTQAATAAFSAFLVQSNQGGPRNDLAALCGSRFVKAAEAEHQARLDETVLKMLTGEDTISARFLYHEVFSYRPQFKIWLATNHKPAIWERTDAIWRRIKLIEFNQKFRGKRSDPSLRGKLDKELPGILAWAVEGCESWMKFGLREPQRVTTATLGYRQESNQVGRFLKDRCQLQDDERTSAKALYNGFLLWCATNHEKPLATNQLAAKLEERGLQRKRSSKGIMYLGVALLPVAPSNTPAAISKYRKEGVDGK
jgi:putative DNA primase/helicase